MTDKLISFLGELSRHAEKMLTSVDDYDSRCVGRHESEDCVVSTARVDDAPWPYETAVWHRGLGEKIRPVETYITAEAAKAGHSHWVREMSEFTPDDPAKLRRINDAWEQIFDWWAKHNFPSVVDPLSRKEER